MIDSSASLLLSNHIFWFVKMTLDEVKRTAQQQMTRVLKDQSRLVWIILLLKELFFGGHQNDTIGYQFLRDCGLNKILAVFSVGVYYMDPA